MGERPERSPTSIALEAPSAPRRVGLEFPPPFSPEDLFGPDWLVIAQAESPEDQAQKPAVLNKKPLQTAQEMTARVTERVKEYTKIDLTDRMTLVEVIEILNALAKTAVGGIGMSEVLAIIAATLTIEGVKMVTLRGDSTEVDDFSKLAMIGEIAKKALIHHVEQKVAEKVVTEGIKEVKKLKNAA